MSLFRFGRAKPPSAPPVELPASVPAGTRIYAFGDVHGRIDLVEPLFSAIENDARGSDAERCIVVGLGDYVDRGGRPKAVVEALADWHIPCELVALRGNHEQMLLDFLEDPVRRGAGWIANGAFETLRSYDVALTRLNRLSDDELMAIRNQFARNLPPSHLVYLQRLPLTYLSGDYLFVHAGVRLGSPLEDQRARDLLWGSAEFDEGDEPFEKVVVHGHTPVDQPYLGRYRINLDTGAYYTRHLSCVVLEGTNRRLLDF